MVEVWLRYGRTMIFTDLENSFEVLQPARNWSQTEKLADELAGLVGKGMRKVVVDYVHGLTGFEKVIESVAMAFRLAGVDLESVEAYVSSWRYGDVSVERSLFNVVRNLLDDQGVKKVSQMAATGPDLSDAVVVSPAVFWEGDVQCCRDFLNYMGARSAGAVVSPVVGCGGVVADVLVAENPNGDDLVEAVFKAAAYKPSSNPEIILAGGPGHPVDSKLSTCINLAASAVNIQPGKVVVYAFECSEGLGSKPFIETLLGKTEDAFFKKRVDLWKNTASMHKICLVTALPSTIVEKVLGARQSDTLDQAVVYGRRVKSREANVLVVENVLGTMLTGF
ncbi:MAG: hypothetical protein NZ581_03415 [Candidatus Caldarchaeum sp.]|nr:hypothetical protein [Candidatus Caldarchaeum sp.]MDW8435231.1 hypothetical protein [Candidatus Caldarchaeum sp.]